MTTDEITIRTNHVPRFTLDSWELTPKEREEFDYLDWPALDNGSDSATFFRYKGRTYDLGEFMTTGGMPEFSPLRRWDGYMSDWFFGGVVVKWTKDFEAVIVGTFHA